MVMRCNESNSREATLAGFCTSYALLLHSTDASPWAYAVENTSSLEQMSILERIGMHAKTQDPHGAHMLSGPWQGQVYGISLIWDQMNYIKV